MLKAVSNKPISKNAKNAIQAISLITMFVPLRSPDFHGTRLIWISGQATMIKMWSFLGMSSQLAKLTNSILMLRSPKARLR